MQNASAWMKLHILYEHWRQRVPISKPGNEECFFLYINIYWYINHIIISICLISIFTSRIAFKLTYFVPPFPINTILTLYNLVKVMCFHCFESKPFSVLMQYSIGGALYKYGTQTGSLLQLKLSQCLSVLRHNKQAPCWLKCKCFRVSFVNRPLLSGLILSNNLNSPMHLFSRLYTPTLMLNFATGVFALGLEDFYRSCPDYVGITRYYSQLICHTTWWRHHMKISRYYWALWRKSTEKGLVIGRFWYDLTLLWRHSNSDNAPWRGEAFIPSVLLTSM